jgi:hypothetical protein
LSGGDRKLKDTLDALRCEFDAINAALKLPSISSPSKC